MSANVTMAVNTFATTRRDPTFVLVLMVFKSTMTRERAEVIYRTC